MVPGRKLTKASAKSVFPWFALPREMRDEIYEHLLTFKQKTISGSPARMRARDALDPKFLVLSKQFSREYRARAEHRTSIVIADRSGFHGEMLKLPHHLQYVTRLRIYVALVCCDIEHDGGQGCRILKELRMHRKWIDNLAEQMHFLADVSIKALLDPHSFIDQCEKELIKHQHKLTAIDGLSRMEVYRCDFEGLRDRWNFVKPKTLTMRLGKGRELERVADEATASDSSKTKKAGDGL